MARIVLLLLLGLSLRAEAARVPTLPQVFEAAVRRSEDVETSEEARVQAEESYQQAKAALFPTINLVGSIVRQDVPPVGPGSAIFPADQRRLQVALVQPLFRGFREYAGLRRQSILSESARLNREQALVQLYQDVSALYDQAYLAWAERVEFESELDANQKRKDELLRFRKLGRSRESEVLTLEANVASLSAQVEAAKVAEQNAHLALELLTGVKWVGSVSDLDPPTPHQLGKLDLWLTRVDQRADLQALQKAETAALEDIKIARGAHWPSLDLNGNYYFTRPGVLNSVNWDVGLSLTFPIFQGGALASQTDQAISRHRQSELALVRARRVAAEEVQTRFALVQSQIKQFSDLARAVLAWEKVVNSQKRDSALGVVTNLEVLQAMSSVQASRRAKIRALVQAHLEYQRLKAAVGERPELREGKYVPQ